jgi:hypothetical protein
MRIWALVDTAFETEPRDFVLFATGQALPLGEVSQHVGTVALAGGDLVLHLFEVLS